MLKSKKNWFFNEAIDFYLFCLSLSKINNFSHIIINFSLTLTPLPASCLRLHCLHNWSFHIIWSDLISKQSARFKATYYKFCIRHVCVHVCICLWAFLCCNRWEELSRIALETSARGYLVDPTQDLKYCQKLHKLIPTYT